VVGEPSRCGEPIGSGELGVFGEHAGETRGDGIFGSVTYVQRLDTTGGLAPATACADGQTRGIPYTAEYRFYVKA
jgi:hypothetical protein